MITARRTESLPAEAPEYLLLGLASRHGLLAGVTGIGKTVTLQVLPKALEPPELAADWR